MCLRLRQCFYLSLIVMVVLSQVCSAQSQPGTQTQSSKPAQNAPDSSNDPNGISVGRPKVFDNRTLTIMLDNLSESLRNIQFVDQKTLATAFNLLQGYQSRESASSLSISTLPIPGITQDVTSTTGNVTSSGTPLPDTTSKKTSTKSDVFTPQAPV